jgi:hypothetical protein
MKRTRQELELLNFELFQCYDIQRNQIKFDKKQKAKKIEQRKKVLQEKFDKYH